MKSGKCDIIVTCRSKVLANTTTFKRSALLGFPCLSKSDWTRHQWQQPMTVNQRLGFRCQTALFAKVSSLLPLARTTAVGEQEWRLVASFPCSALPCWAFLPIWQLPATTLLALPQRCALNSSHAGFPSCLRCGCLTFFSKPKCVFHLRSMF